MKTRIKIKDAKTRKKYKSHDGDLKARTRLYIKIQQLRLTTILRTLHLICDYVSDYQRGNL